MFIRFPPLGKSSVHDSLIILTCFLLFIRGLKSKVCFGKQV